MSELHDAITRNVRVIMAVRGIDGYAALATILEIDPDSVSNKMRGKRQWTLENLERLSQGLRVAPESLIGDGRDLLDPNLEATGTTGARPDARRYVPAGVNGIVIPFPQVDAIGPSLGSTALVLPLRRPSHTHASRPSRTVAV